MRDEAHNSSRQAHAIELRALSHATRRQSKWTETKREDARVPAMSGTGTEFCAMSVSTGMVNPSPTPWMIMYRHSTAQNKTRKKAA